MRVVQHERGNIGISTEGGDHQGKKLYMIAPSCGAKKNDSCEMNQQKDQIKMSQILSRFACFHQQSVDVNVS